MLAITIGRFADQHIRLRRRRCRIFQNRLVVSPDIAREQRNRLSVALGEGQLQAGGSKDVPRVIRSNAKLRTDIEAAAAWHALELFRSGINMLRLVTRLRVVATTVVVDPWEQHGRWLARRGTLAR